MLQNKGSFESRRTSNIFEPDFKCHCSKKRISALLLSIVVFYNGEFYVFYTLQHTWVQHHLVTGVYELFKQFSLTNIKYFHSLHGSSVESINFLVDNLIKKICDSECLDV